MRAIALVCLAAAFACSDGSAGAMPDAGGADAIPPRDVGHVSADAAVPPPLADGGLPTSGLFSVARDDLYLRQLDPETGDVIAAVLMLVPDSAIIGCNGLAADPDDGTLFVLLRAPDTTGRNLAIIDPTTGAVDIRGDTGDRFAGLAFDNLGTLWGITGHRATAPTAVFSIDPQDASTQLAQQLGNGDDGEALAWEPVNNVMLHATGFDEPGVELIDMDSLVFPLPWRDLGPGEILSWVWLPGADAFLAAVQDGAGTSTLVSADSVVVAGNVLMDWSEFGSGPLDYAPKGLAFVP